MNGWLDGWMGRLRERGYNNKPLLLTHNVDTLFVCLYPHELFVSYLAAGTISGDRTAILAVKAFTRKHSFTCHTCCNTGSQFIRSHLTKRNPCSTVGFDWLIIYGFTSRLRIFHLYGDVTIAGERLQNLGLCLALRAFVQGGIFIVPNLLWQGTSVYPVS
jgi:hypothetical protein